MTKSNKTKTIIMATTSKKNEESKAPSKANANAANGLRYLFEVGFKDIYYAEKY